MTRVLDPIEYNVRRSPNIPIALNREHTNAWILGFHLLASTINNYNYSGGIIRGTSLNDSTTRVLSARELFARANGCSQFAYFYKCRYRWRVPAFERSVNVPRRPIPAVFRTIHNAWAGTRCVSSSYSSFLRISHGLAARQCEHQIR